MESTFWTAFGASSLAALVTSIGIYVIRHFGRWGRENSIYFICFAAGVLISVSFLHIIPKAFSMNGNGPIYLKKFSFLALGAGILVAFIIILSKA